MGTKTGIKSFSRFFVCTLFLSFHLLVFRVHYQAILPDVFHHLENLIRTYVNEFFAAKRERCKLLFLASCIAR